MTPIARITYSSHFLRAFQNLPWDVQQAAAKRENIFRKNCFDPRLKTHKLHGSLAGHWSFSIQYKYRIMFRFLAPDQAYFIDAGDHSIYN